MNNLPPGFTVDPPSGGLPPGFTVDKPSPPPKAEPDSFWSRFGTGVADPIYGAAQIADKAINPIRQMISPGASSMEDVIRERDANYRAPDLVGRWRCRWCCLAGRAAADRSR
jgi:hypothetical protein